LEETVNGLILTDGAATQATAEGNEVLIGEATSLRGWMAAFDTSPTGSAEVARDDIEAGMKGLFKVAQFRAESDGRRIIVSTRLS
jgi:hypothetical protein